MASRKFWFSLDVDTDKDIIDHIEQRAGQGRTSKILTRIIYEYYNNVANQQQNAMQSDQSDKDLIAGFEDIFK